MTIRNKCDGFGPHVEIEGGSTYIYLYDSYKNYLQEWGLRTSWKYYWDNMAINHYKDVVNEIRRV